MENLPLWSDHAGVTCDCHGQDAPPAEYRIEWQRQTTLPEVDILKIHVCREDLSLMVAHACGKAVGQTVEVTYIL